MNNKKAKKVLIVGGGIGGLSAAIALRRKGIEVDLVELQPEWNVYGVGIVQQGNVVRAMAELGIADQCLAQGYSFDSVKLCDSSGKQAIVIPGARLAGEEFPVNVALPRIDLHNILLGEATRVGVTIQLGLTVDRIDQSADQVTVQLSDGQQSSYDLLIGADGIYSKVRSLVFGEDLRPSFSGQGGWRFNLPRFPEIDCLTMYRGKNGGQAGFCPLKDNLMYLLQTTEEPGNPWMPKDQLHVLFRERLAEFEGPVAKARDEYLTDPSQVIYKPFESIFMDQPWFDGRVVLIGDSAHATTPHLGQGAGMAIEDGVVLAEELAEREVDGALHAFMQRRFERCKFVVESSLQIGKWEMERNTTADYHGLTKKMIEITSQPI